MTTEKTLLTADDLLKLPDDGRHLELLDGELIEMAPTGGRHGDVSANVTYELESYVRSQDLGKVLSNDPGIILRRNPDTVRTPDVCFFARDRVPPGGIPDGLLDLIPDFVVEVVSPGDSAADVQQNGHERAGHPEA